MHCLKENAPMMRLARKLGMDVATEAGDAWLELGTADAGGYFSEVFVQLGGALTSP